MATIQFTSAACAVESSVESSAKPLGSPVPAIPRATIASALVCTDGKPQSFAALHVAAAIAEQTGALISVLRVLSMFPFDNGLLFAEGGWAIDQERVERELDVIATQEVRGQLALLASPPDWKVLIRHGSAAIEIVRAAAQSRSDLIVMGSGEHRLIDRALWGETALDVLRIAETPVLVVPALERPYLRAAACVDFGDASVRAAVLASRLLMPGGELSLVHAMASTETQNIEEAGRRRAYERGIEASFELVEREIASVANVSVSRRILHGDPVRELAAFAERVRPDLLASGRENHGWVERVLIGSVASALVRNARSAVLVVPARLDERTR